MVRRTWHGPAAQPRPTTRDGTAPENRSDWAGGHAIDLRASLPLPGGSWYVTIVAGRERRSQDRLEREGQTHWFRQVAIYVVASAVTLWLLACAIIAAYLLKSVLNLDIFDGPSPLHFIYDRLFDAAAGVVQGIANAITAMAATAP